jgi:hypothetical protein
MRKLGAVTAATAALFATIPFVTGATAGAAESHCWTTEPVPVTNEGVWTYSFQVRWCAEGTKITRQKGNVTHEVLNQDCTWAGRLKDSETPAEDGTGLTVKNVSQFKCPADISAKGVNPWVIVTVQPSGTYTVVQTGKYL